MLCFLLINTHVTRTKESNLFCTYERIFIFVAFIVRARMPKCFQEGGNCILAAYYGALCDCGIYFYCQMHNKTAQWCLRISWNMYYFQNVACLHTHTKGYYKLITIRFLENPFNYKQMYLFSLFVVGLLFKIVFPYQILVLLLLEVFWASLSLLPLICESERGWSQVSICWRWDGWCVSSGVWLSCASGPYVQRLLTWRRWDHPGAPKGCKVVYFGFPLSKYRTLFFALVPIMPTNYLLPLLAQSNQMQLIYSVSLWVFSHNRHAPLWVQGTLFIPLELCVFGGGGEEAQEWFPNFSPPKIPFTFSLMNPGFCKILPAKLQLTILKSAVIPFLWIKDT